MLRNTLLSVAACLLAGLGNQALASLSIVPILGGLPAVGPSINYINFNDLTVQPGTGLPEITTNLANSANPLGTVAVTLAPDGRVALGDVSSQYAAPYINGNSALFGGNTPAVGDDSTPYLTSGSPGPGASATLEFGTSQQYLGLLWGSVDTYNTLTFYDVNDVSVGTIVGSQVTPSASGDQGVGGTFYVNINSTLPFKKVVATSSSKAFEFDNVAYSVSPIPEATTIAVWSVLSLVGFGAAYRKKPKKIA